MRRCVSRMPGEAGLLRGARRRPGRHEQEIKKAYRRLARQYHPDVNKDDPTPRRSSRRSARPTRCSAIPRSGRSTTGSAMPPSSRPAARAGAGGFDPFGGFGGLRRLRRLRRHLRHVLRRRDGGGRGQRPAEAADLALRSGDRLRGGGLRRRDGDRVPRMETCPRCHGTAAEPGTPIATCPQCGGTGEVRQARQTALRPLRQRPAVRPLPRGGEGRRDAVQPVPRRRRSPAQRRGSR